MNNIAFKFVSWDVRPLDSLKDTLAYQVKVKLLNGEKLTRTEKDNLISSMCYRNGYIRNSGWCFSFIEHTKLYLVKQYDVWHEYRAFDKTSLKKLLYGKIQKIVEVKD